MTTPASEMCPVHRVPLSDCGGHVEPWPDPAPASALVAERHHHAECERYCPPDCPCWCHAERPDL